MSSSTLVQKLWNYCNALRDDGMSYGDYVEQLTYLLFLKMTDERSHPPYNQASLVPVNYAWPSLLNRDGDELFDHYRHALDVLGNEKGTLGLIFNKAQNKFQDPAKLRRVIVDLIDKENWSALSADVKGDAYEGLLEKNAQDTKSGAGQYFTPRALIQAMVDCIAPKPGESICDPPFGKKSSTMIVGENGRASTEKDIVERDDFWATTSNKQLNFVQHIKTLLKPHGRAAVVVLDNVLFEGGAGETIRRKLMHECDVHTLLRLPTGLFYAQGVKANVLFFDKKPASENPWTRQLWIYDLRTNKHFTLKTNPLKREDLDQFVRLYNPANRHVRSPTWFDEAHPHPGPLPDREREQSPHPDPLPEGGERATEGRWRVYTYDELIARDKASLDIFWLKDESLADSDNLPAPEIIAREIIDDLEAALEQFRLIEADLSVSGEDPT